MDRPAGKIFSGWEKNPGLFVHEVLIPANTTATLALPLFGFENVTVGEGDSKIWEDNQFIGENQGITEVTEEFNKIVQ